MSTLSSSGLLPSLGPTAAWTGSLLLALAREEAAGRSTERLTEPRLATWSRFRGRLRANDLVELLFENAAVIHPIPFDPGMLGEQMRVDQLPQQTVEDWLAAVSTLDLHSSAIEYMAEQARLLALPTRLARSDLHVVKPHQKVLELPGTGGQLAHHLLLNQDDLTLQDNFTLACANWQELTMAGIVALDRAAPHTRFVHKVDVSELREPDHPLRQRPFDFVIGLHPDKGGFFRIEDQLAIWYPGARVILV